MAIVRDSGSLRDPRRYHVAIRDALSLINARRREWSPPAGSAPATLMAPLLPGGSSNQSFLLRAGSDLLVLRLDGIDPRRNAIDRGTEFRLHAAAAAAGLAPRPRFCDAGAGVLLVDYLAPDPGPAVYSAADVGDLLRAVHQLAADAPRLSLDARARHYAAILETSCDDAVRDALARLSEPMARACQALDSDSEATVICHNDLTRGNRLRHRGRLYALDWEYAARGGRWFDLAVAADGLLDALALLEAYLQRQATAPERAQMTRARLTAQYLELLWLACNTNITPRDVLVGLRDLASRVDTVAGINHAT